MRIFLLPVLLLATVAAAQETFSVVLTEVGPNKIVVIKEVRAATGLGLKEAKDLVEAPMPQPIKKGVTRETADALVAAFEKAGAKVEARGLKSSTPSRPPAAIEGSYSVRLESYGASKIACIKEVRLATGLGLAETKKLVESAPVFVKEGLTKEQADTLVKALVAAGGTASAILARK